MRERHADDLEILMRTYTEKPRTEVDWKGFAYDPFLDGSSSISVGLVATRMLMRQSRPWACRSPPSRSTR